MIDFSQLVTAAAVGTGTRPLRNADLPGPIATAVAPPGRGSVAAGEVDPAAVLLDAAAGYALLRWAEVAPGPDLPPLRLPARSRPEPPEAALSLLHRVRAGGPLRELQHEALSALAARGFTLPPDLLLALLAEASRAEVARDVAGLLDERGWALVALEPAWAAALKRAGSAGHAADPRLWADGSTSQRAEYLAALRRLDPAAARALLAGRDIAAEPAETRELLLGQLAVGLGPDDEELLEEWLSDRGRGVRRTAAALLSRLDGSAFVARAEALAVRHVHPRPGLLRPPVTVVEPVPVTDATRRDQYRGRDAAQTPAERLQLLDVLGIVPPSRWPALVGATAVELATGPAEYAGVPIDLRPAFAQAALRWRDAELAAVLAGAEPALLVPLLPVLAADTRERLLVAALAGDRATEVAAAAVRAPLTPRVAVAALDALRRLAQQRARLHLVVELLGPLAVHADPLAAPALVDRLRAFEQALPREGSPALRRALMAASTTLQLRQGLAEALLAHPAPTPDQEG